MLYGGKYVSTLLGEISPFQSIIMQIRVVSPSFKLSSLPSWEKQLPTKPVTMKGLYCPLEPKEG